MEEEDGDDFEDEFMCSEHDNDGWCNNCGEKYASDSCCVRPDEEVIQCCPCCGEVITSEKCCLRILETRARSVDESHGLAHYKWWKHEDEGEITCACDQRFSGHFGDSWDMFVGHLVGMKASFIPSKPERQLLCTICKNVSTSGEDHRECIRAGRVCKHCGQPSYWDFHGACLDAHEANFPSVKKTMVRPTGYIQAPVGMPQGIHPNIIKWDLETRIPNISQEMLDLLTGETTNMFSLYKASVYNEETGHVYWYSEEPIAAKSQDSARNKVIAALTEDLDFEGDSDIEFDNVGDLLDVAKVVVSPF